MQIMLTASDGTKYEMFRDASHEHPEAVHEALDTESEAELQLYLDQMWVGDWYDEDGRHTGPDCDGLEMFLDDDERFDERGIRVVRV